MLLSFICLISLKRRKKVEIRVISHKNSARSCKRVLNSSIFKLNQNKSITIARTL